MSGYKEITLNSKINYSLKKKKVQENANSFFTHQGIKVALAK